MKRKPLPQDVLVHDLSQMELDNITEEIEKTIAAMDAHPPQKEEGKKIPKSARWSYWT